MYNFFVLCKIASSSLEKSWVPLFKWNRMKIKTQGFHPHRAFPGHTQSEHRVIFSLSLLRGWKKKQKRSASQKAKNKPGPGCPHASSHAGRCSHQSRRQRTQGTMERYTAEERRERKGFQKVKLKGNVFVYKIKVQREQIKKNWRMSRRSPEMHFALFLILKIKLLDANH